MLEGKRSLWAAALLVVGPLLVAVVLYGPDGEIIAGELPGYGSPPMVVRRRNERVGEWVERIGEGSLLGPEDVAYDAEEGALYTGCADGWIRKVAAVSGKEGRPLAVTNFSYVGGRPLGLAFTPQKELIVCDSLKGLLKVKDGGDVEVLTDEADGMKFGLADGVDVGRDGTIYFTDASYKYRLKEYAMDVFCGRPHGRLLSFDPVTRQTKVLMDGLYFPNGVAIAPGLDFLVFCESPLASCKKYYIEGEKKGTWESFMENMPGAPDNIRYDGDGTFWIGMAAVRDATFDRLMRSPLLRSASMFMTKLGLLAKVQSKVQSSSGVLAVDTEGKAIALYLDPALGPVTGGLKIGDYLYFSFLHSPYLARLNVKTHPAVLM